MFRPKRTFAVAFLLVVSLSLTQRLLVAQAAKPLAEDKIVQFLKVGLDDDVIVGQLQKSGVAFSVDDAALKRLKEAGASDSVLAAVRAAGAAAAKPAAAARKAVTYDDVLGLLQSGVPEAAIQKALKSSPTVFVLAADQLAALKQAGASDALLASMQGGRVDVRSAEISNLAIILDCSLSMKEGTKGGGMKMTVAKRVVAELIQGIPEGLSVTFFIYGHDKLQQCNAVRKIWNLAPLDAAGKSKLSGFISSLQPVGNTPIALALRSAGQELAAAQGASGLVLISDGKETCQGDPSAEAAALAKNLNLTFGVNVIGFGVSGEEQASLEAVAAAGHGKYYDADTAAEFREVIQAIRARVQAAAKPAEVKVIRSGRRSIRVLKPKSLPMPAGMLITLHKANTVPDPNNARVEDGITSTREFGTIMMVPSADPVDVIIQPLGGWGIFAVRNVSIPEPKAVDINLEDHLGVVRCTTKGLPEITNLFLTKAGQNESHPGVQSCSKFAMPLLVPPGTYDLWMGPLGAKDQKLESNIVVKAGTLVEIE